MWGDGSEDWHADVPEMNTVPSFDARGDYLHQTVASISSVPSWLVNLRRLSTSVNDTTDLPFDKDAPVDNDREPIKVLKHQLSSSKVNYATYRPRM